MPTTENDRLNRQQPVLENPSLPDHDRTKDEGMHMAIPDEMREHPEHGGQQAQPSQKKTSIGQPSPFDEDELAPPDQEFDQILRSGYSANHGRIPDDPNNWLTSDPETSYEGNDPENRGESLPDILEGDKH